MESLLKDVKNLKEYTGLVESCIRESKEVVIEKIKEEIKNYPVSITNNWIERVLCDCGNISEYNHLHGDYECPQCKRQERIKVNNIVSNPQDEDEPRNYRVFTTLYLSEDLIVFGDLFFDIISSFEKDAEDVEILSEVKSKFKEEDFELDIGFDSKGYFSQGGIYAYSEKYGFRVYDEGKFVLLRDQILSEYNRTNDIMFNLNPFVEKSRKGLKVIESFKEYMNTFIYREDYTSMQESHPEAYFQSLMEKDFFYGESFYKNFAFVDFFKTRRISSDKYLELLNSSNIPELVEKTKEEYLNHNDFTDKIEKELLENNALFIRVNPYSETDKNLNLKVDYFCPKCLNKDSFVEEVVKGIPNHPSPNRIVCSDCGKEYHYNYIHKYALKQNTYNNIYEYALKQNTYNNISEYSFDELKSFEEFEININYDWVYIPYVNSLIAKELDGENNIYSTIYSKSEIDIKRLRLTDKQVDCLSENGLASLRDIVKLKDAEDLIVGIYDEGEIVYYVKQNLSHGNFNKVDYTSARDFVFDNNDSYNFVNVDYLGNKKDFQKMLNNKKLSFNEYDSFIWFVENIVYDGEGELSNEDYYEYLHFFPKGFPSLFTINESSELVMKDPFFKNLFREYFKELEYEPKAEIQVFFNIDASNSSEALWIEKKDKTLLKKYIDEYGRGRSLNKKLLVVLNLYNQILDDLSASTHGAISRNNPKDYNHHNLNVLYKEFDDAPYMDLYIRDSIFGRYRFSCRTIYRNTGINLSDMFSYIDSLYNTQGISSIEGLEIWKDYIGMARDLGYDMKDKKILYPSSLKREHDLCVMLLNKMKDEKAKLSFKSLKDENKHLEITVDDYVFILPENSHDLLEEGNALDHCVGSYVDQIAEKEAIIIFMREADNPNKPLYTIELSNDAQRVMQAKGRFNSMIDNNERAEKALIKWANINNIKIFRY